MYGNFFSFLAGQPRGYEYVTRTGLLFWGGLLGLTTRFIAVILGLVSAYLLWIKEQHFSNVKHLVVAALLLESLYFVGLIPSVTFLQSLSTDFLAVAYVLQIIFVAPVLTILAVKLRKYESRMSNFGVLRWAGIAFVGYVAAMWANSLFRWFDMISIVGWHFLNSGPRVVGFLNTAVLMSLAVFSAMVGVYRLFNKAEKSARRWGGLSLALVGLHFVIYLIYSYYDGALDFVLLVDIWAMSLLGLGVALLTTKPE